MKYVIEVFQLLCVMDKEDLMVVNFEFLGEEPIENIITCMNFKIDKVVFFGYHDVIEIQRTHTEKFLKKYCEVKKVVFHPLSRHDLQSTLKTMRIEIQYELARNNQIYFDITGGESLILVAFGMLSKEFGTPIHMYDIVSDKLIELDKGAKARISEDVEIRKIPITLNLLIQMHGGKINSNLHKNIKGLNNDGFMADVDKIYQIAKQNWDYWNPFADFLRNIMVPVDANTFQVSIRAQTVMNALAESNTKLKTINKLNEIVDALSDAGILLDVEHGNGDYRFKFKNQEIKECLWEGGSILELHTCQKESRNSNECQVGIHLDWDGIIHDQPGDDVLNEIDVLSIKGNVPTFISCKSGKMAAQQALHALYELDTVTRRFGGKYAKKVLVTAQELGDVYRERAKEMGIEVR